MPIKDIAAAHGPGYVVYKVAEPRLQNGVLTGRQCIGHENGFGAMSKSNWLRSTGMTLHKSEISIIWGEEEDLEP